MLGGMLLGIIETFSSVYIKFLPSDAIVFFVLIIILLVKPAGLLGKQVQEKV
jgi:branched-chain amino acid transport system permease protein